MSLAKYLEKLVLGSPAAAHLVGKVPKRFGGLLGEGGLVERGTKHAKAASASMDVFGKQFDRERALLPITTGALIGDELIAKPLSEDVREQRRRGRLSGRIDDLAERIGI